MEFFYKDLSYKIQGAVFNVYNNLGSGHKEVIYQKALELEFSKQKIYFLREPNLAIKYDGKIIGKYRPDFLVDDKIILELKAVEFVPRNYEQQLIHYLKSTEYKVGFLINFGGGKLYVKRLVWSGNYLRESA